MDICIIPVNNGLELCLNINCNIHNKDDNYPLKKYEEKKLCGHILNENEPIIPTITYKKKKYGYNNSAKGQLCCYNKVNGKDYCKKHNETSINEKKVSKEKKFYSCHYQYDLDKIKEKYNSIKDINILHSEIYCGNITYNSNHLCNIHYNCKVCPCNKHNIIEKLECNIFNYKLKELLFNNDIYSNINKHIDKFSIKLLNCSNLYHNKINKSLNKSIIFTQKNNRKEIIDNLKLFMNNVMTFINTSDKIVECIKIYDYLKINKKFLINNFKFSITVINKLQEFKKDNDFNKEFKKKCEDYIYELYNIKSKTLDELLEKLRNNTWPYKTKNGTFCKNCLKLGEYNYCYQHKIT